MYFLKTYADSVIAVHTNYLSVRCESIHFLVFLLFKNSYSMCVVLLYYWILGVRIYAYSSLPYDNISFSNFYFFKKVFTYLKINL